MNWASSGELHDEDKVNAKKWCEAVNNAKRHGRLTFEACREVGKLHSTLESLSEELREGVAVVPDAPSAEQFVSYLTAQPIYSRVKDVGKILFVAELLSPVVAPDL